MVFWIALCQEVCASEAEPADVCALIQQYRNSLWITEDHVYDILSFKLCDTLVSEIIDDLIYHCSVGKGVKRGTTVLPSNLIF